jgi:Flp pilus assembly protein TadG
MDRSAAQRAGRVRSRDESGDAVTETVIAVPMLILFILATMQFVLWGHAGAVAQAAATEGARAARIDGGSAAAGRQTALDFLAQTGSTQILDPVVTVDADAERARAEVTGRVPKLIPFLELRVHAVSEGPVEVFRPPTSTGGTP